MSRRRIVPEVIQTSGMDCGPASLTALMSGFGIPVSYGRLREACQTDVDGTSISTMEEVACQLGLECEEIMLPADHLLLPAAEALPAIVVVRLPSGVTHFVVVWSVHGPLVQVMDPGTGRRWMTRQELLDQLYSHVTPVPAEGWREWAGSAAFRGALSARLAALGIAGAALVDAAMADPGWEGAAALDAATRMIASVVAADGLRRGAEAGAALSAVLADPEAIPEQSWSVRPGEPDEDGDAQVLMRGAVLVRALEATPIDPDTLNPELRAALTEPPPRPLATLLAHLSADGLLAPAVLVGAMVVAAGAVLIEALLLRGLMELAALLPVAVERAAALAGVLVLIAAGGLIELAVTRGVLATGRALEGRLRLSFLEKIPRLPDQYFQSRLISDMAERSHAAHLLRRVPVLAQSLLQGTARLLLTTIGIIWLAPGAAPLAVLSALVAVALPLLCHPLLSEQDLRVRSHLGALSRFSLDALLGLTPIRAHGAQRALRREHESRLVEWGRAGLALQRSAVAIQGLIALVGLSMAVGLVALFAADQGGLLLIYWALALPAYGQQIAVASRQYPAMRSVLLRLIEPLLAPETTPPDAIAPLPGSGGVEITARDLGVLAGGHPILRGLNLTIAPGSHVAIVGASGSGKSSLVGLLLGWHRPATGTLLIDGEPLDAERIAALRQRTAWVDPEVRLWNRTLLENLRYGAAPGAPVGEALSDAALMDVLDHLPEGLQTPLGEGGGRLSGGQGQRVRLGRALARGPSRLAILDEPFRGLDRPLRRRLLAATRAHFSQATLLFVSHDIDHTASFDRVLVIGEGTILEDGAPEELLKTDSRYRALMEAEASVRSGLWSGKSWRNLSLSGGDLTEGSDV